MMRAGWVMLGTVLWLGGAGGAAESATFGARVHWNPSAGGATGYAVYVRTAGGQYGTPLDAGLPAPAGDGTLAFVVPNLDMQTDHLFVVTARAADGTESAQSNELSLGYAQVAAIVDSDADGLTDAQEDRNLNRVVDAGETDPQNPDSDGDGILDGRDACQGTPLGEAVAPDGCGCSQRACDDGNACTTDSCTAGQCQHVAVSNGTTCGDGNVCNGLETCQNGTCTAGSALNCDDGNPCTTDACSTTAGCTHAPINGCQVCTSTSQCDDANACTADACSGGRCQHTAVVNGMSCSDGNACNGAETCQGGTCTAGSAPNCDDGNVCTTDACSPSTGCSHTPIGGCVACTNASQCDDGNACTTDACTAGRCAHTTAANGTSCSDGNACNGAETCQGGTCTAGSAPNCDDGNVCTTDACNRASGCTHTPIGGCAACTSAAQCDDANPCTTDTCTAGHCQHGAAPNGTSCADGNACNGTETCRAGTCTAGVAPSCDDGNACTTDSCVPTVGCLHEGVPGCCVSDADCQDADVCTQNERCTAGRCVSDARVCPGGPCQQGTCDPTTGCSTMPVPDGTACSGGDACGASGVCTAGACQATARSLAGASAVDFSVTRFVLRPAGKKSFDLTADGDLQAPAFAELVQGGVDIELSDDTGALLYLAQVPGATLVGRGSDFLYTRVRGAAAVPGLRRLELRLTSTGVGVSLRASVPRTVGQAVRADLRGAQAPTSRRLNWLMRLGPDCSRNVDLTCPATRSVIRRCD